jgi:putative ABC transport system permease protein
VNQTFARRYWPGQNPVGKHIVVGRGPRPSEVIAVAADIKNRGIDQTTQPQLYLAFPQLPWGNMNLLLRTSVAPLSMTSAVRAQIAAMDPEQPITKIQTVEAIMDASRAQPRFTALLVGIFSTTALALALIGIYGVLSYSVAQRTQEFGIRLALGAKRADIQGLVLRQALALAIAGIVIGIAAALMLTRLAGGMLYKTGARSGDFCSRSAGIPHRRPARRLSARAPRHEGGSHGSDPVRPLLSASHSLDTPGLSRVRDHSRS